MFQISYFCSKYFAHTEKHVKVQYAIHKYKTVHLNTFNNWHIGDLAKATSQHSLQGLKKRMSPCFTDVRYRCFFFVCCCQIAVAS